MKTLIVYTTKHGTTEKCVYMLLEKLTGKVDLYNLKSKIDPDLAQYDKVVIGGSIYIGKIQKEVIEFCSSNLDVLKGKKLGLFVCGMQDADTMKVQLNSAFSQELLVNSIAKETFGGEFIFNNLNFIERLIVKKVSKVEKDTSNISKYAIDRFAQLMNNA